MTRASLPGAGYELPLQVREATDGLTVRMIEERTGRARDFEFSRFPGARAVVRAVAEGFARAVGPGGTRRTLQSAATLHSDLRIFCRHLAEHEFPPAQIDALRPFHLADLRRAGDKQSIGAVHAVRLVLRHHPDLPQAFSALLVAPMKAGAPARPVLAYSVAEFRAIRRRMRSIVRGAITRVRAVERELDELPGDRQDFTARQRLLHHAATTGDVSRRSGRRPDAIPGAAAAAAELFPSMSEVAAAAVLLQCMTGHNIGTLVELTTKHHRADDQEKDDATILVRGRKPRRGRYRAELDLTFDSTNVWGDTTVGRDDFNSAAGVYLIVEELCRRARTLSASSFLFVGYSQYRRPVRGDGTMQGCRPLDDFSQHARYLMWTYRAEERTGVNSMRVRRAFLQQRQRPVDHSLRTLTDTYLRNETSALQENQQVVANALNSEVARVGAYAHIRTLSANDVRSAASDPNALASKLGVTVPVLQDLLSGELDTVATACTDNMSSPFSPVGEACTASFLLCFSCVNARAEPRHAPIQRALLREIDHRRQEMPANEWAARFSSLREQVSHAVSQFGANADASPPEGTDALINDLLDGRLDLR